MYFAWIQSKIRIDDRVQIVFTGITLENVTLEKTDRKPMQGGAKWQKTAKKTFPRNESNKNSI